MSLLHLLTTIVIVGWLTAASDLAAAFAQEQNPPRAPRGPDSSREHARRTASLKAAGIDINSVEALVAALEHESLGVRYGAVYLLAKKRDRSAVPALTKLLSAKEPLLRLEVCDALHQLGTPSKTWAIVPTELLKDSNSMVAIRAAGLLARVGDAAGWDVIATAVREKNPSVVLAAARVALRFEPLKRKTAARGEEPIPVYSVLTEAFRNADASLQRTLIAAFHGAKTDAAIATLASWREHARDATNVAQIEQLSRTLAERAEGGRS